MVSSQKDGKEHKWTEEDFELLFNGMTTIIENQEQIRNGIIALAKKEGLEVTIKDSEGEIKYNGE